MRGGGSKPALSAAATLDVGHLRGIVEYDPSELTVTALAGTPIAELQAELAAHGQHLPFDPPLAAAGATAGGVVAAGTSGPGRYRHGGVRDFVIGARFVDGEGELVGGAGRVVKNAAGFDLPRLLVGSLGRLGVLIEVAFKVFPAPAAWATLAVEAQDGFATLARAAASGLDVEALDLEPPGRVLVRIGGPADGLDARLARLEAYLGLPAQRFTGAPEAALWTDARELTWMPPGTAAVRVALTPRAAAKLDPALNGAERRYVAGATAAWIAWPHAPEELDAILRTAGLSGVRLTGGAGPVLLGAELGGEFARRAGMALRARTPVAAVL